jgi:signal transduction histidine kinase
MHPVKTWAPQAFGWFASLAIRNPTIIVAAVGILLVAAIAIAAWAVIWRSQAYTIGAIALAAAAFVVLIVLLLGRLLALQLRLRDAERARASAEAANAAKRDFLANMSHELRTPLNAIIGFTELLERQYGGTLSASQLGYVQDIALSGRRLLDVINSILDMSKIEDGTYDLADETVEIATVVGDVLALLHPRAEAGDISLQTKLAADLPPLRADSRALVQVVLNVLDNAIKFTGRGGMVTLTAGKSSRSAVEILVRDTGIGIAPERLAHIFEPFQGIDAHQSREHGGSGLGLPISKMIVERHGGQMAITSKPSAGTTVAIRLPVRRVARRAGAGHTTGKAQTAL